MLGWWAAAHQRTQGSITSSHQELGRALQGDKGNISPSALPHLIWWMTALVTSRQYV